MPKTKAAMPVPKAEVEAGNDYMSSIEGKWTVESFRWTLPTSNIT